MIIRRSSQALAAAIPKRRCVTCDREKFDGEFRGKETTCMICVQRQALLEQPEQSVAKIRKALNAMVNDSMLGEESIKNITEAVTSGRIGPGLAKDLGFEPGQFACTYCGMRFFTRHNADDCCGPGVREHVRKHGPLRELGVNLRGVTYD